MSVGCDGEEVTQGGREEAGELGFGEEFEEGRFGIVEGRVEGGHELHVGGCGGKLSKRAVVKC